MAPSDGVWKGDRGQVRKLPSTQTAKYAPNTQMCSCSPAVPVHRTRTLRFTGTCVLSIEKMTPETELLLLSLLFLSLSCLLPLFSPLPLSSFYLLLSLPVLSSSLLFLSSSPPLPLFPSSLLFLSRARYRSVPCVACRGRGAVLVPILTAAAIKAGLHRPPRSSSRCGDSRGILSASVLRLWPVHVHVHVQQRSTGTCSLNIVHQICLKAFRRRSTVLRVNLSQ